MEVDFVKMNPTENMTILVQTPLPQSDYRAVGEALMDYANVFAEQVGFLEKPHSPQAQARLLMAGGEFCGNATISTAVLHALRGGKKAGENLHLLLEVSGIEALVPVDVQIDSLSSGIGTVEMPPVLSIKMVKLQSAAKDYEVPVVELDGITHIIFGAALAGGTDAERRLFAESVIHSWNDVLKPEALGILLYQKEGEAHRITPLVYVAGSGTLVWERGCGSGTAATGAYLAYRAKESVNTEIVQPGGKIKVSAVWNGNSVSSIKITGRSSVVVRGTAYI